MDIKDIARQAYQAKDIDRLWAAFVLVADTPIKVTNATKVSRIHAKQPHTKRGPYLKTVGMTQALVDHFGTKKEAAKHIKISDATVGTILRIPGKTVRPNIVAKIRECYIATFPEGTSPLA